MQGKQPAGPVKEAGEGTNGHTEDLLVAGRIMVRCLAGPDAGAEWSEIYDGYVQIDGGVDISPDEAAILRRLVAETQETP